jgi:large subunit ribosomal protein L35
MAKVKQKTNKTATKRFKLTGTGKITRRKSYNNHMFFNKSASQKRRLEQEPVLSDTERTRVCRMLAIPTGGMCNDPGFLNRRRAARAAKRKAAEEITQVRSKLNL